MKTIRRLNSLILATIMMLTVLVLPASAEVGGRWTGKFKSFDYIARGSTGLYVSAMQRYLMSFDSTAKSLLAYKNSAGQTIYMDGDFGGGTEKAVVYVQEKLGCAPNMQDGKVGEDTWGRIELDLDRYKGNNNEIILKRDLYNPNYVYKIATSPYDGVTEMLAYYDGSNNATLVVFAWA